MPGPCPHRRRREMAASKREISWRPARCAMVSESTNKTRENAVGKLCVTAVSTASITVEQLPEGHRWDFPVMILDDNRRCLAHADFQAARDAAVNQRATEAAYSLAEEEAYKRHIIG